MRKMLDSSNTVCSVAFSDRADARSRPNGFSTTIRAPDVHPALPSPLATVSNMAGGMAR